MVDVDVHPFCARKEESERTSGEPAPETEFDKALRRYPKNEES